MATIVTRIGKGSALTYLEADTNWTGLNDELATVIDGAFSFEAVSKNLSASDATIAYAGDNIGTITYANGIVKTFSYGVDGLETIVLSGATPSGIDLTKTLQYTLGEFTGFAYS